MTFLNHKASEELSNNQGAKTKGPVDRKRFMSVSADCAAPVGEAARPAVGVHPRDEDDPLRPPPSGATSPRHAAKQPRMIASLMRNLLDHRARQVADGWRLVREIRDETIGAMRRLGGARTAAPVPRKVHTPNPAKESVRETYAAAAADSPCVLCASLAETARGACGARRGEGRVLSCAHCTRQFGEGCVRSLLASPALASKERPINGGAYEAALEWLCDEKVEGELGFICPACELAALSADQIQPPATIMVRLVLVLVTGRAAAMAAARTTTNNATDDVFLLTLAPRTVFVSNLLMK